VLLAVAEQILLDVGDVERAQQRAAIRQIRANGANRLRAGEVSRHGNDQVAVLERLDVLVVLLRRQKAAWLAGEVVRVPRELREVAAAAAGTAARRDRRTVVEKGVEHRLE